MDIILTLQESVKLLKVDSEKKYDDYGINDYYDGYYNQYQQSNYQSKFELDDSLEKVQTMVNELVDEVNIQLDNELTARDVKKVLRGVKSTIVNQLGKGNSRMWRQWEEQASYQTTYRGSLMDYFEHYRNERDYTKSKTTKPTTPAKTTVSTQYNYRPKKTLKWELVIKEECGTFIKKMMALNKKSEWGVAFSWIMDKENKQIIIDRIYIMPVNQGGAHVSFVNESEYIIFQDISELGKFITDLGEDRFAGIMHSHHGMGSWHSSTDHGTIATYINDFNSVLSLVWAWKGGDSEITVDAILKSKKDGFLLDNIVFENEVSSNDKDIENIDSELVDRYNNMVEIVQRDYPKYKVILEQFEKTKKFIPIYNLYNQLYYSDINNVTIETIKQIIKH